MRRPYATAGVIKGIGAEGVEAGMSLRRLAGYICG